MYDPEFIEKYANLLKTFREDWPSGAWTDEPDREQWLDGDSGLECLVQRMSTGSLCGYVGLPSGHPWFELSYADAPLEAVRVHGKITYANSSQGLVCCPGDKLLWWIGFDCAHNGLDLYPGRASSITGFLLSMEPMWSDVEEGPASYKTFPQVKKWTIELARLAAAASGGTV